MIIDKRQQYRKESNPLMLFESGLMSLMMSKGVLIQIFRCSRALITIQTCGAKNNTGMLFQSSLMSMGVSKLNFLVLSCVGDHLSLIGFSLKEGNHKEKKMNKSVLIRVFRC